MHVLSSSVRNICCSPAIKTNTVSNEFLFTGSAVSPFLNETKFFVIFVHYFNSRFEFLQGDDGDVSHPASPELDFSKTLKFVFIMKIYALCVFMFFVCFVFFIK